MTRIHAIAPNKGMAQRLQTYLTSTLGVPARRYARTVVFDTQKTAADVEAFCREQGIEISNHYIVLGALQ